MKHVILDTSAGREISITLTFMEADDLTIDLNFVLDQGADLEPSSMALLKVLDKFVREDVLAQP